MTLRSATFLLAASLCAFAAVNAGAQTTNDFTFSAQIHEQGTNTIVNVTNTVYATPTVVMQNNAQLLEELGQAVNPTNGFTAAAKLVLITVSNGTPIFAVIDGMNFYSSVSNIMTITTPPGGTLESGTMNIVTGLASPTIKDLEFVELSYDDTGTALGTNGLKFDYTGLASASTTDTAPAGNGSYTETFKATANDLVGDGSVAGRPFVGTAKVTVSGSGTITP